MFTGYDMIVTCQSRKCPWHGEPVFEECDDVIYVKMVCPKCHTFIRMIKRQDVPKKYTIFKKDNTWWEKVKAAESELRPAYMMQKELARLRIDHAALQAENEHLKKVITETTEILKDALEREGLIEHVPAWMKE